MFNPQLDQLIWRKIEKRVNGKWTESHMIDLKRGDRFRAFDHDGSVVKDKDGATEFIAHTNGYICELGVPVVDVGGVDPIS